MALPTEDEARRFLHIAMLEREAPLASRLNKDERRSARLAAVIFRLFRGAGAVDRMQNVPFYRDCRPVRLYPVCPECRKSPDQVAPPDVSICVPLWVVMRLILVDQEGGRVQRLRAPHWREWLPPLGTSAHARGQGCRPQHWRLRAIAFIAAKNCALWASMAIARRCADLALDVKRIPFLRNRCYSARQRYQVSVIARAAWPMRIWRAAFCR